MGWNGSSAATSAAMNKKIAKPRKASSGVPMSGAFKGTLALILVLAIGAGAYWFTASDEVKAKVVEKLPKKSTNVIAEVEADLTPVEKPVVEEVALPEPAKKVVDPDFQANYPRTPGHLPLRGGNVVTFTPPAPGKTTQVITVGGIYICDSEGNFEKYEAPQLFDNRFDNTIESLAMNRTLILTDRSKDFSDEEIATYLTSPITLNEDDTPDIIDRKIATAEMKDEIKQFIKEGGSFDEYIDKLHSVMATERVLHREVVKELVNMISEGDIEGAREIRSMMNEQLKEGGYMGVKLPEVWERKLEGLDDDDE